MDALVSLINETRALFHRMADTSDNLHSKEGVTAGMRGIMLNLYDEGPLTVSHMARIRPVSRQHIQILVNALLKSGLANKMDNPHHKRSPLIELTTKGRTCLETMQKREFAYLDDLPLGVSVKKIKKASLCLEAFRRSLEDRSTKR